MADEPELQLIKFEGTQTLVTAEETRQRLLAATELSKRTQADGSGMFEDALPFAQILLAPRADSIRAIMPLNDVLPIGGVLRAIFQQGGFVCDLLDTLDEEEFWAGEDE